MKKEILKYGAITLALLIVLTIWANYTKQKTKEAIEIKEPDYILEIQEINKDIATTKEVIRWAEEELKTLEMIKNKKADDLKTLLDLDLK